MRFFSNDAKETNDGEPDRDDEAAAVPQQRVGSPWSDAPADSSETSATADTATAVDTSDDGPDAHDLGGPGSGPDDQVDLPLDERSTFDDPQVNESTVTSPDASVNEPTDAETTGTDADPAIRDEGDFDAPQAVEPATDQPLDAGTDAADTDTADTDTTEGDATEVDTTDTDTTDTDTADTDTAGTDTADTDTADTDTTEGDATEVDTTDTGTDVDTPVAATPVESDSDSTTYASAASADDSATDHDDALTEDPTPADTADSTAAVAAVPVAVAAADAVPARAAKPGSVPEKGLDSLFAYSDAQAFRDRWRDVQLRFVDSPKDATAEAAGLVDEAVDILTAGLKAQKDTLLSDSDDTEKLRLELRGYRDILNKVLGL
jgi:hypothetical protein